MNNLRLQYLTEKIKAEQLTHLEEAIAKGEVDRPIVSYLKRLNAIKGVCTTSACYGHGRHAGGAHILIWPSRNMYNFLIKDRGVNKLIPYIPRVIVVRQSAFEINKDGEQGFEEPYIGISFFIVETRWRKSIEKLINLLNSYNPK